MLELHIDKKINLHCVTLLDTSNAEERSVETALANFISSACSEMKN
jgi:hypothetical protein